MIVASGGCASWRRSPAPAFADAGIPLLPVKYPTVLWFLVPVIVIETAYLQAALRTRWLRTLAAVTSVNVGTTGLGYPLAWLLYAALNQYAGFPGGTLRRADRMAHGAGLGLHEVLSRLVRYVRISWWRFWRCSSPCWCRRICSRAISNHG